MSHIFYIMFPSRHLSLHKRGGKKHWEVLALAEYWVKHLIVFRLAGSKWYSGIQKGPVIGNARSWGKTQHRKWAQQLTTCHEVVQAKKWKKPAKHMFQRGWKTMQDAHSSQYWTAKSWTSTWIVPGEQVRLSAGAQKDHNLELRQDIYISDLRKTATHLKSGRRLSTNVI